MWIVKEIQHFDESYSTGLGLAAFFGPSRQGLNISTGPDDNIKITYEGGQTLIRVLECEKTSDDIEITHEGGQSIVRGLEREKIREFRDTVKRSGGTGFIPFRGVSKIDVLRKGCDDPVQTILGESGGDE